MVESHEEQRCEETGLFTSVFGSRTIQLVSFSLVVGLMSNLNAMVDLVLHPDIPYFDPEHLIVGGVTGLVSALLFGSFFLARAPTRAGPDEDPHPRANSFILFELQEDSKTG